MSLLAVTRVQKTPWEIQTLPKEVGHKTSHKFIKQGQNPTSLFGDTHTNTHKERERNTVFKHYHNKAIYTDQESRYDELIMYAFWFKTFSNSNCSLTENHEAK